MWRYACITILGFLLFFSFSSSAQESPTGDGQYIFPGVGPLECLDALCPTPTVAQGWVSASKQVCIASDCGIEVSWEYDGLSDGETACVYLEGQLIECGANGKTTLKTLEENERLTVELRENSTVLSSTYIIGLEDVAKPVSNTITEDVKNDYLKSFSEGSATSSWDGRLFFSFGGTERLDEAGNVIRDEDGDPERERALHVKLFDPNKLTENPDGTLNFRNQFSESEVLATEDKLGVVPGGHLAVFPHPSFKGNPYASNATGAASALGGYQTYNFYGIIPSRKFLSFSDELRRHVLGIFHAIVVIDPKTDTIVHTEIQEKARALTYGGGENYLYGYEPSISLDGHMVVYSGNPYNGIRNANGGMVTYSFTHDAFDSDGWSEPRNIADMYETHGAGASSEPIIKGKKFSDIFPIGRHDVVDYNGEPVSEVFGAYPWFSYDASEAFFQTVPGWHGGRRHGATMVGARTRGKLMNVDGDLSLTRGNPTGRTRIFRNAATTSTLYAELETAYRALKYPTNSTDLCTRDNNAANLGRAFNEVLLSPIALFGTSWNPFLEQKNPLLPLSQSDLTYGFLSSAGNKYAEVPIVDNMDSLLLYYPMNEPVRYDNESISEYVDGLDRRELLSAIDTKLFNTFVTDEVADYSPYHHTGSLAHNGLQFARFPYEQCKVDRVWQNDRLTGDLLDTSNGAIGNSVAFERGGEIRTSLSPEASLSLVESQEFTAAFWVNRGTPDFVRGRAETESYIMHVRDLFTVRLDNENFVLESPLLSETGGRFSFPTRIQNNWNHYAVRLNGGIFTVFLNGVEIGKVSADQSITQPSSGRFNVRIGPGNSFTGTGIQLVGPPASQAAEEPVSNASGAASSSSFGFGEPQNPTPIDFPEIDPNLVVPEYYDVMQMDEVYLYRTGLTQKEISKLAWRKENVDENKAANEGDFFPVAEIFEDLPQNAVKLPDLDDSDAFRDLGEALFRSTALSTDGTISCSSCHTPREFFADTTAFSTGVDQNTTSRNTPTLLNLLFSDDFFADGKVSSLEEQVLHPLLSNTELGLSDNTTDFFTNLENTLGDKFDDAFGGDENVNYTNIALSLSHYIRGLIFVPSDQQLTENQFKGRQIFEGRGNCIACHSGPNLTDNEFHNIGLDVCSQTPDIGRKAITGRDEDCNKFKTPTLLGVNNTAPYFHDGRAESLRDVINHYNGGRRTDEFTSDLIRPLGLSDSDISELEAYLLSLGNRDRSR